MTQIRAVIIDDDRNRREIIKNSLPDYIESIDIGFGEGAIDYIKRDAEGNLPDLVILNGDDSKNLGLYVFDWMINKSGDPDVAMIPVIVITEDEFSDRCLDFLELGDVTFFEGDPGDSELFSVITEAIEEAEFMAEPVEQVYEETKNIDRLMGHSVKAPGGRQRAVVLDMDNRVKNLEAALARGRKRVDDIRNLLDAAQNYKSGRKNVPARNRRSEPKEQNIIRMSSFLEKARKKADVEEELLEMYRKKMEHPEENKYKRREAKAEEPAPKPVSEPVPEPVEDFDLSGSVDKLKEKAMGNPFGAFNAQGTVRVERKQEPDAGERKFDSSKKTVVIVDDDLKTRKLCTLFLTQKYNVVSLDSGIKTVDYFIKNRADLLIINPILGGMSGISTINSVRLHPGGSNIPVMYLVGDNYTGARTKLLGPGVVGILNKPIKQSTIAQSVDGFFDNASRNQFRF